MNLPEYFLADVEGGPVLTPGLLTDACLTLKENRRRHLRDRTTGELIERLADVAEDWREPDNPFRRRALAEGPELTGFSAATLERGLDELFGGITVESLRALVIQELGHPERLERACGLEAEQFQGRQAWALGSDLVVHIVGGLLPNPPILNLILGLLARSAQLMKCARGTSFLPRLFAHSLREVAPGLAACLEIAEWPGGEERLEDALFAQADLVTVIGGDDTVAALRRRVPPRVRLIEHGHRVSAGYVAREMCSRRMLPQVAAAAARDVAAWDQLGCLSPQAFYVETGGRLEPAAFAGELAAALEAVEKEQPRGRAPAKVAAAIAAHRGFYEVRAANSNDTRLWCSSGSTAWTVVSEADPRFRPTGGYRFVYVKTVTGPEEALQGLEPAERQVSTVGLAAPGNREAELVARFARWGVTRICPLGRMQNPPLTWRHDGRLTLGELVRWCDWERSPGW